MTIKCPHCQTEYSIDPEVLEQANNTVACSHCQRIFHATTSSREDKDDLWGFSLDELQSHDPQPTEARDLLQELDEIQPPADDAPAAAHMNHGIPEDMHRLKAEEVPPEFLNHYLPDKKTKSPLWMLLAVLLLILGAAGQLAWAYRDQLMQTPRIAALYRSACDLIGCTLRPASMTSNIRISSHHLRSYNNEKNTYELDARLHNPSNNAEPLPSLELQLLDDRQQVIARRTFSPTQYAYDDRGSTRLEAGANYQIKLILVHKGPLYRGYELNLIPGRS